MERLLRIESLVHGGDGLARDDGRVVFVPLTAPGDLVRVVIEAERGGVPRGRLLEVVERGPARQEPPCPIAGRCGGCQWQQVSIEEQQRQKEGIVRDALIRIGGFREPPLNPLVPSPRTWRYRRRARVRLTPKGWGFAPLFSHDVIDVASCLLLESDVEQLIHETVAALHEVGASEISACVIDKGAAFLDTKEPPTPKLRKRMEKLLGKVPRLSGIVLGTTLIGQPVLIDDEHRRLRVRPDLFAQANRIGARLLAEATAATVESGSSVLEIFAGSGTLTLFLAEKTSRLVATEGDGPALDLLRAGLRDLKQDARLMAGPAERMVVGLADEHESFDHVVLDPPRTGAKEIMPAVARLARKAITYVSCDPATFARDAKSLCNLGWKLSSVTPFDLFPQTHHVELVALFER